MAYRVYLDLLGLLETRDHQDHLERTAHQELLDPVDHLALMDLLDPQVFLGHLDPEDPKERRVSVVFPESWDLLDLLGHLDNQLAMMQLLYPPFSAKDPPRVPIHLLQMSPSECSDQNFQMKKRRILSLELTRT